MTLAQFLSSAYEGDASAVMSSSAMASQTKLESWVAATPKLRSSRKHREMMLATPSHSALLATTQRLTRASARKLNPSAVTGLGSSSMEDVESSAASSSQLTMPIPAPINLADAVYETPSARGKARSRLGDAKAATVAAGTFSIASLMLTAARSGAAGASSKNNSNLPDSKRMAAFSKGKPAKYRK